MVALVCPRTKKMTNRKCQCNQLSSISIAAHSLLYLARMNGARNGPWNLVVGGSFLCVERAGNKRKGRELGKRMEEKDSGNKKKLVG